VDGSTAQGSHANADPLNECKPGVRRPRRCSH